jgi:pimeloyl-ACP methyl ester carboxylesterase
MCPAARRIPHHHRRPARFGQSSRPTVGHDYNTFAEDLDVVLEYLELTGCVLAGFPMGTGEVTRDVGTCGSSPVSKTLLMGAIPPFLLKTDDNPDGVEQSVFGDIRPRSSLSDPVAVDQDNRLRGSVILAELDVVGVSFQTVVVDMAGLSAA